MPVPGPDVLANLGNMSDVSDIAEWCVGKGHGDVILRTRRPHLRDALTNSGLKIVEEVSDLVMWLDDEIGTSAPWPFCSTSCELLIEGSLPVQRGLHAIAVETDRAVLLSADGIQYRRIEFMDNQTFTVNIEPIAIEILDESAHQAGFTLVNRWIDWSMETALGSEPCHLSLFRNF